MLGGLLGDSSGAVYRAQLLYEFGVVGGIQRLGESVSGLVLSADPLVDHVASRQLLLDEAIAKVNVLRATVRGVVAHSDAD